MSPPMPKFFGFFSQTGPVGSLAGALLASLEYGAGAGFLPLAAFFSAG